MVRSGIDALDEVVQGLRLGDNVVWQVDALGDYEYVVRPFVTQAIAAGSMPASTVSKASVSVSGRLVVQTSSRARRL